MIIISTLGLYHWFYTTFKVYYFRPRRLAIDYLTESDLTRSSGLLILYSINKQLGTPHNMHRLIISRALQFKLADDLNPK
jgi:hypothetical protein